MTTPLDITVDLSLFWGGSAGSFTLFGQQATGSSVSTDATAQTLGMQFKLSDNATLLSVWFYSAPGATALPTSCLLYQMTGAGAGSIVPGSQVSSPAWSGPAGSGWVNVSYASGPALTAGTVYKVCVTKDTTSLVYSGTSHYWDTGAGQNGLTSGIITAPNNAGGDGGQDTFVAAVPGYPTGSFNATNYWIDVEVV